MRLLLYSTHQVFPSFCGRDVRKGFLSHLLKEFKSKGIVSFIDNDIERSRSIGPELIEAIKGSRISIVLISENYASSTWCLDELVQIMKCREELGQTVMTIFYEVDPSDVEKQMGYFGTVFGETCVGKTVESVEKWKKALEDVTKNVGYDSSSWKYEADMIEKVATDVANKLNNATPSTDFDGLVGIGEHITQINSLLSLDSSDVRMVGIWGLPGIGKTTIARALYNKLSNKFTHTAFMESTRGSCEKRYSDDIAFMLHLQEQLLSKILNQKDLKISHLGVAEERLRDEKVLVVLDDVDESMQLKAMAWKAQWFGCGSRIIITTKDKKLLKAHGINHTYHVDFPSSSEALEILCHSAFGQKSPNVGFEELIMEVTRLAGNLPLSLSVFGSYLRGMPKPAWIDALPALRTSLNGNIEKVLRFSYEALCDKDKDLFLHIACLFKGETTSYLEECLAESDLDVRHGLQVLDEKSLVSINEEQLLVMHNLVERFGKEIVRKEYKDEPGRRKFLVDAREICDVLADNTGYGTVLGIDLNLASIKDEYIDERAFEGMSRLQFLRFYNHYDNNNKMILPQGLNNLPRKLRVLHWHNFPMNFLPPKFRAEFLIILDMRNSSLEKLWEGAPPLRCLKRMDLSYSVNLKEVPNLSNASSLETLTLDACKNLVEIPTWIQNLTRLTDLKMVGCEKLKVLPTNINLESLYHLDLSRCSQLKRFPEISTSIVDLILEDTSIEAVPSSISMVELDLSDTGINLLGGELEAIPDCSEEDGALLLRLNLNGCKNLVSLPQLPVSLSFIDASNCELLERIEGFFDNPQTNLNFANCLKLNKEARELLHTSASMIAVLPCGEMPSYFSHQGTGSSLTITYRRAMPKFLRFRACILLAPYSGTSRRFGVSWCIWDSRNGLLGENVCSFSLEELVTDHLLTFVASNFLEKDYDPEVVVTCSELLFVFTIVDEEIINTYGAWERVEYDSLKLTIMGCGVRILDVHGEDSFIFPDIQLNDQ
ncbi:hypothetical protein AALP_AA3G074000 [Arabis alpina]|uniref:ADP-ribosyl cyclase/cyclic ADP-ribose hydrolase n=1 Tax=Arabis alpina TaxID=50452 RepID=A0A087H7N2_ARAAL|nr:hypothetical protein AALP_AA3G074000 [Arabis alpina]